MRICVSHSDDRVGLTLLVRRFTKPLTVIQPLEIVLIPFTPTVVKGFTATSGVVVGVA